MAAVCESEKLAPNMNPGHESRRGLVDQGRGGMRLVRHEKVAERDAQGELEMQKYRLAPEKP